MFEKVREMLSEQMDIDLEMITPDTDIAEDLGLDSLDVVELLTTIETEYSIVIEQDSIKDVHTVGDVVDVIERLI